MLSEARRTSEVNNFAGHNVLVPFFSWDILVIAMAYFSLRLEYVTIYDAQESLAKLVLSWSRERRERSIALVPPLTACGLVCHNVSLPYAQPGQSFTTLLEVDCSRYGLLHL